MKGNGGLGWVLLAVLAAPVSLGSQAVYSRPGQQPEKRSVEGVIYDLKHPEAKRRKEAAYILGENKVREAVPALVDLTEDREDDVRLEAVRALVKINDTRALQAYIRLTRDPLRAIQKKAIEGIINIYVVEEGGFVRSLRKVVDFVNPFSDDYNPLVVEPYIPVSQEAIQALAALLSADKKDLRKEAATALGILRAHSALPAIQQALGREKESEVKVELIRAVYKIGDPAAGTSVLPLVRDPDRKVRDEAILTVGRLRLAEAVPVLTEIYNSGIEERKKILGLVPVSGSDELQKKVLEALAYIGDSRNVDLFLNLLTDQRDFYRRQGAEGLARGKASEYVTIMARYYLTEPSSSVKLAMSYALFRMGREEHLVELVREINHGDQAYFYLLELEPEKIPLLYPYVQSESNDIKARLLDVIGLRADRSGLEIAEQMTGHENAEVVSAANLAIRRIRARHPEA